MSDLDFDFGFTAVTEDELDEILFYGKQNKKAN